MKKIFAVLVFGFFLVAGCATHTPTPAPVYTGQSQQFVEGDVLPANTKAGIGRQPPVGKRTVRTYFSPDGRGYTNNDKGALQISGFIIAFWGKPGEMLEPLKGRAIQKWVCSGKFRYIIYFDCESEARRFMADSQKEGKLAQYRDILDRSSLMEDPSGPGAKQVFIPLK